MFVDHVIEKNERTKNPWGQRGAPRPGLLYEVVYAANGTWIRARRYGLAAQIPYVIYPKNIPGLMIANLVVSLPERINHNILSYLVEKSRENLPDEILFYLRYQAGWKVTIPTQKSGPARVIPDEFASMDVLVEVHSHNTMRAFFSETDNRDETGFRIYAVLGQLNKPRPEISVRVGIYGWRALIPADLVFQNPGFLGVDDVNR